MGEEAGVVSDPGGLPQMSLPVHRLAWYLRVRLEVAGGRLRWEAPRALLGIVPAGRRHLAVPVAEVVSVRWRRSVPHPWRLLVGASCVAAPWAVGALFGGWWWALAALVVFGLWVILVSRGPNLEVTTRSGGAHRTPVCFTHRMDAELFAAGVEDLAARAARARGTSPG